MHSASICWAQEHRVQSCFSIVDSTHGSLKPTRGIPGSNMSWNKHWLTACITYTWHKRQSKESCLRSWSQSCISKSFGSRSQNWARNSLRKVVFSSRSTCGEKPFKCSICSSSWIINPSGKSVNHQICCNGHAMHDVHINCHMLQSNRGWESRWHFFGSWLSPLFRPQNG